MRNKNASVAKWVALAVVPLILTVVVSRVGQQRRAEAATKALLNEFSTIDAGRPNVVEELISEGANVNAHDADGETPLHLAMEYHSDQAPQEKTITILLDHGADVNARNAHQVTPLMGAVDDSQLVRLLLSRGANIHLQSDNGKTALDVAQMDWELSQSVAGGQPWSPDQGDHLLKTIRLLKAAGAKE